MEKDLTDLGITYEQVISSKMTKQKLKIIAWNAAFNQLLEKQRNHKKIKHSAYRTLEVQQYLKSDLLTQKNMYKHSQPSDPTALKEYKRLFQKCSNCQNTVPSNVAVKKHNTRIHKNICYNAKD